VPRPITATIDLGALRHNLAVAQRCAPRSRVFAVIKANAYGHGLVRAARAMDAAAGFALLELDAAVQLREAGFRQRIVLIEGFFDARELPVLVRHRLAAVVHNRDQLGMLEELAIEALRSNPGVGTITLLTHFANADDARGVAWQMAAFERVARGTGFPRSLANSAAILRYPETHLDWVRPGIMLYGCSPFAEKTGAELDLKPAMTLASQLIGIQQLKRGDAVGYGDRWPGDRHRWPCVHGHAVRRS
jgi:alanine racemase